jgi:hypothetical protein
MLYVIIQFWFLFDGTSIYVYMSGLVRRWIYKIYILDLHILFEMVNT